MNFKSIKNKESRTGLIGTLIFHGLLLLLLFFLSMKPPTPPRPIIGLEVNLGNSAQGMGEVQPEKLSEPQNAQPKKASNAADEVATQDTEEAINLKKKDTKNAKPVIEDQNKVDENYTFKKKSNSSANSNQGNTNQPGDQGMENGDANSNNYSGDGGNGTGGKSYKLKGRKAKSLPKPVYNNSEEADVVVKIWVDRNGKVVNTAIQTMGTNTSNSTLHRLSMESAKKAVFDSNPNAPEVQTGTITYKFTL